MGAFGKGRGKRLTIIRNMALVTATMLLSACGSSGVNPSGSNARQTGAPAPTPTPTPTLPPTTTDSAEYKAPAGVAAMNAAYAYDRGITGMGVTIAIVDTGIDTNGTEFADRISPKITSFDQKIARCRTCPAETASCTQKRRCCRS